MSPSSTSSAVSGIPAGHSSVVPAIIVKGGAAAIAFYEKAFGAECVYRMDGPGGIIYHAELRLNGCMFFLCDEYPDLKLKSPLTLGARSSSMTVYVDDPDAAFARAVAAGGTGNDPVTTGFHGMRGGSVTCPFGHRWNLCRQVEVVSPEEMKRRMEQWETAQTK